MKTLSYFCYAFLAIFLIGCKQVDTEEQTLQPAQKSFAIAIHGGAGFMAKENMSDSIQELYKTKLKEAITAGHKILEEGGEAVDAVQASIRILEDSPLFNAGKGAVLNHNERPELDASIMEGKSLQAGAVAGISHIKNPIDLAIEIMKHSKHVMLAGAGAEKFAEERGFSMVPEEYFITEDRLRAVRTAKKSDKFSYFDNHLQVDKMGTVGCVALDKNGNLAAGTSTGGLNNKDYGRIGDSPIIGAGTYANNQTCAVSCTGEGEYFIRGNVAYDVSALMEYSKMDLSQATQKVIHEKQPALGGTGGLIAIDSYGNISMEFNTSGMFRAQMDDSGNLEIGIFKD